MGNMEGNVDLAEVAPKLELMIRRARLNGIHSLKSPMMIVK